MWLCKRFSELLIEIAPECNGMKKISLVVIPLLLALVVPAYSQEKYTINGYVRDSLSAETLIGASVIVSELETGVRSNAYGFYSITLPAGKYTIQVSFAGYIAMAYEVNLQSDIAYDFNLLPKDYLEEVVITAGRGNVNVKQPQLGRVDLNLTQVKALPVVLGETDILKTLQLLPGVASAGEGNTGLYVRGGGPDQNLIILDDAVVYNPGHLFGFFSIFNGDAIKNLSLYKGGMPAQYGGRISAVLDASMKDGNMKEFEAEGGIGVIASRLSVQGPIKKNKASFIVSARRTYIDVLIKPFIGKESSFRGSGYYFYDLNAKLNYKISDKDRLYLSGYFGRDVFNFNNKNEALQLNIPWGNATATVRWNHVFNTRLFSNLTFVYNDYGFEFSAAQKDFVQTLKSGIQDLNLKYDMDYFVSPRHKLKFGGQAIYHTFIPNMFSGSQDETELMPLNDLKKYALESAIYFQDEWDITKKLAVNAGLRFGSFTQLGPYTVYEKDINGNKIDSAVFGKNELIKTYNGLEPRLTFRYQLDNQQSFKASVSRNLQYIHLVSNAGTSLPTDLWVPSTYKVKPQISKQVSAGYFRNFANNSFESSVEVYYRDLQNQIEYKEGYSPSLRDPEEDFVYGKGWSYGAEFFINKTKGDFTGWLGYSLSWTWRKFPDLNEGMKYPAKYDRRHDISAVATYELNDKWTLSAVFVYGTGNAISLPERFYIIEGNLIQEYGKINQGRLPAYHRMDLSATLTPQQKPGRKLQSSWVFSIYNAYNRYNPYFIYYNAEGSPFDGSLKVEAKKVSIFPILPSVTWNFRLK